jgi:DNA polymerase-4
MGRSADLPRRHSNGVDAADDTDCPILHVDMDAFFASVEIRRDPSLAGRPVIVGGGRRGVVAAASYRAREFGVRSAMPMGQALRLCPQAVVIRPDHAAYAAVSREVFAIFADVTSLVEGLSLDEAFLDVSGAIRRAGRPVEIARAIRARVQAELGLTCSVGIASTKFIAKLASARCKPDGLLVIPATQTQAFVHPLPVGALWGVGARTAQVLAGLGLRTVGELAATPPDTLRRAVGAAQGDHLLALARGHDPRQVTPGTGEKSVSTERTFERDVTDPAKVRLELLRLCDELGSRVRAKSVRGCTIAIKVRFGDFRTLTRARTLPEGVDDGAVIYAVARDLYDALALDQPRIRLLGVRADHLVDSAVAAEQLTFDLGMQVAPASAPAGLGEVMDRARSRFGAQALRPGSLVPSPASARRDHAVP